MKRFFQKNCYSIALTLLLCFIVSPAFGQNLRKGPYLLWGGSNTQMQVLWQNDATSSDLIEWGTDLQYNIGTSYSPEDTSDHRHQQLLDNLTPGTKYYYRVTIGINSYTGGFHAAPDADASALKFLAYGDTRTYPADHNTVAGKINAAYADTADPAYQTILIAVGDLVGTGDNEVSWTNEYFPLNYSEIREMLANVPMLSSIGNHEGTGVLFKKYFPYPYGTGRFYWSFDYGPAHFAVVDQYDTSYGPGSAQYAWLQNDLSSSTKPWKFVYLHEPGWSAKGGHDNNTYVQQYIQPLCEQYGIPILFAGHNHYYARAVTYAPDHAPLHHITTGGGGAPLGAPIPTEPNIVAASGSYHFCKINIVNDNELRFEAVDVDGKVIDQFTINRTPEIIISNVRADSITSGSALITWTTNLTASSTVEYGPTATYGKTATGASGVTGHSVSLTGLNSGTIYHYRVISDGVASADYTFTTTGTITSYTPTDTAIETGSLLSGSSINLAANDKKYYGVNSSTSGTLP